jgi:hypothetical protein
MVFDPRALQPELPFFCWEDDDFPYKEYRATKRILYQPTREKYSELQLKGIKAKTEILKLNKKLAGEFSGEPKAVELKKKKISGSIAKQEKVVKNCNEKLVAILNDLFPGTKEDRIFEDDSPMPDYAIEAVLSWANCKIKGWKYVPPEKKFTHDEAEAMLDYMVREQARKEHLTPDEMYEQVKEKVFGGK